MNDPKDQPIDVAEQRDWLSEHKKDTGLSWKQLSSRTGIPHSTLSLFAGNNYNAPGDKIAAAIFRYRQTLTAQAALKVELPTIPSFFETETSRQLIYLLSWAHRGRIVAAALSPGLSKTMTAEHYEACNVNTFLVTCSPTLANIVALQHEIMARLGNPSLAGHPHAISQAIRQRFANLTNPLLIIDEAQHLSERALDELRSWHDDPRVKLGIALFGNAGLLQKLEGQKRALDRAQLFSRISQRLVRVKPLREDVEALIEAWEIANPEVETLIHHIAQTPGALRQTSFVLELATMLARAENNELQLNHVQDAWAQLSSRAVAA
jgi:DNA transposition AAA+ family ATPase